MKKQLLGFTAAALLFPFFSAQADSAHKAFLSAEKIAKNGSYQEFKEAAIQLDHPLKPYVEKMYWQRNPSIERQSEIENYLSIYEHTPLEWPVRKAWLQHLQKHNRKAAYIQNYRTTRNNELTCTYLKYQLDLGAPKKAIFNQVTDLWVVGKSQPKECDSLFSLWRKQGYMSEELVWQRITLSAQGGTRSLLPYLKTLLPRKEQYLADLYSKVRSDPSSAAGLYRYKHKSVKEGEIAHYGIKRLIWRDKALALKAWEKLDAMFDYTDEQKADVYYTFALALASSGHEEARFWLSKVPKERQDRKLMQWQLGNMLKTQDWSGIVAFFTGKENLSLGQQYWLAYSLEQRGDKERANTIWQGVAQERDYYGFLAAARLGLPVQLNNQPLLVSDKLMLNVANAPGFKRAKALYELKRFTSARREWNYLTNTSSEEEKLAASKLAAELDWYDSTIYTLAQIKAWDYVELRFPFAFQDLFERYSKRNHIDVTWSIAISRRESSFAPDARSHANARGLMQLLPSTAKYVNKSRVSGSRLNQPKTNIRLGTEYLEYLKKKNKGNEVLATASYNAGYHRIKRWLPEEAMPAELWVELIPYRETRDYVKNVFAYRQVYHTRLGREGNVLAPILEMKMGG
ncbi:transglycosylase SLT domain-containing protein [Pseudoalteromonas sp. NEC-BIFX-2020_015]|uniref:transglycosylase SLT domain-containing protein n=1 Tax=Pseudoalteromonas sp. NEC-BIFX-2020_015 TaxID=2729544 RepID=UPI00146170B6|nr:transglycosylase SLT domain-containing protein [Pseudoalteromonas sp. NEC-BIFX-2020_015]NMR27213.1 transglycosylase SLT domain-containing protein [Pseudoalteromonas sp. NEC-BIFX-2020_015]